MTLSVWRYAHLALALFSFLFLALASVTGAILAVDAVYEKTPSFRVENFNELSLAETLPTLCKTYPGITEISVDHNEFVKLQGFDEEGNDLLAYIDPQTGKILGIPGKKNSFIESVTSLHRSLFLHETGRFFVGLATFLLLLIAVSGTALIIQRQRGIQRFFSKIVKDYFAQYYHVVAGRILLIPILIIALTGTYLSMERFHLFPGEKTGHKIISPEKKNTPAKRSMAKFPGLQGLKFSDLQKIEFPFSEDADEYYKLKLKDRELIMDQFNGEVLGELHYPTSGILAEYSLDLHTGRSSSIWAIILGIASINILFFIVSGFSILLRRRATRLKNKYKAAESKFILLVGSENGSTLGFANAIHKQLLAQGQRSYITELNKYSIFPKAEHIILFTSTHGLGNAPSNADKFPELVKKYPQDQPVNFSVVGFGSGAYVDFCGFAKDVNALLLEQSWAMPFLELNTVNDKSAGQFTTWVKAWSEKTGLPLSTTPASYNQKPKGLQKMMVLEKSLVTGSDQTFLMTLRPASGTKFTSGDLLAIYPGTEGKERFYSIGKVDGNIQLAVKLHPQGAGSNYLNDLKTGSVLKARVLQNKTFYFPKNAPQVVMVANGTGIAPFLGMIKENKKKTGSYLYCGFRQETELTSKYKEFIAEQIKKQHLTRSDIAFSREANRCYVMDLIKRDATFFAGLLAQGGTVMICGSRAMQADVEATLNTICLGKTGKDLMHFKTKGQILVDSY